jgi:hypothetical protein
MQMQNSEKFDVLFQTAKENYSKEIGDLFNKFGNESDKKFIEKLAYYTQLVIKKTPPNFNHGFLLYYALSKYLSSITKKDSLFLLDIGTARGFSSLVMSYVLQEKNFNAAIISIDKISHTKKVKWNSILDREFGISRKDIVERFRESARVIFLKGKSKNILNNLNLPRVNFAFVDGDHRWGSLKTEIVYLMNNQKQGDVFLFDDYTPKIYPGVSKAVNFLKGAYSIEIFGDVSARGYALLTKIS